MRPRLQLILRDDNNNDDMVMVMWDNNNDDMAMVRRKKRIKYGTDGTNMMKGMMMIRMAMMVTIIPTKIKNHYLLATVVCTTGGKVSLSKVLMVYSSSLPGPSMYSLYSPYSSPTCCLLKNTRSLLPWRSALFSPP